ncbi:peptidylprolyl isomerase [Paracoccus chinensis]|uniref:Parvulin-like PPIase n=1 Tax=Paracoccus chinensis TaxID=525640 RepID=A0A1G9DN88_9RHOB|nr:peptidylprolyl isomerase [Paracoccus chinensis]SDK65235.1 periplasmic chaperone for outer membrane proteins SurA [Paracoccus chinensis]
MRRMIHATTMAVLLAATALPALTQAGPLSPVAYVNNSAVTQYELDQRVRFLEILRAPDANREAALQALIDDRLKLQAARQMGIAVTDQGLEQGLAEFAGRANLSIEAFTEALAREGVDRQAYRDFVRAGVAWREVVRQRIVPTITVSDREVEQELTREIETPIVTQVLVSELVIPAPPGQEQAALALAQRLSETVTSAGEFSAAARQYSAVPSAAQGGQVPWTPLENLAPGLRNIILGLQPGSISQPLTVQGAVVLFFLRDTRGRLRAGAEAQTVDYVELSLPSAAEGARILSVADSCETVYVEANRIPGDVIRRQTQSLDAVPLDVAQRLASLDPNEGTIIDYGAGVRLVMLCDRTPSLIADTTPSTTLPGLPVPARREEAPAAGAAEAPNAQNAASDAAQAAGVAGDGAPPLRSREDVRAVIFNRKATLAADAYLAELRADALMRRP